MAKRATFKPYFKNSVVQQNKGDCKDEDKRAVAAWLRKTFFLFFFHLFYNQKRLSNRHLHK